MTEVKDDPREVLALLNSLGFVGITAPQLKAFMKELKLHRKIKEHQQQQWKEEAKKKILHKQEILLKEMLRNTLIGERSKSFENNESSASSSRHEDSLVRIRVRCVSDEEDDEESKTSYNVQSQLPKSKEHERKSRLRSAERNEKIGGASNFVSGGDASQKTLRSKKNEEFKAEEAGRNVSAERRKVSLRRGTESSVAQEREKFVQPARPLSAPEYRTDEHVPKERSKSVASDPTGLSNARNNPSRCSTRSHTKSFIRPWRLQPEAQRAASSRKSDPVALYQKYRQEWKQISFPGEEQHARVRWAIREKMLGTDPNPRPILKNSQSLQSLRKR